jgi:hypothetical protein
MVIAKTRKNKPGRKRRAQIRKRQLLARQELLLPRQPQRRGEEVGQAAADADAERLALGGDSGELSPSEALKPRLELDKRGTIERIEQTQRFAVATLQDERSNHLANEARREVQAMAETLRELPPGTDLSFQREKDALDCLLNRFIIIIRDAAEHAGLGAPPPDQPPPRAPTAKRRGQHVDPSFSRGSLSGPAREKELNKQREKAARKLGTAEPSRQAMREELKDKLANVATIRDQYKVHNQLSRGTSSRVMEWSDAHIAELDRTTVGQKRKLAALSNRLCPSIASANLQADPWREWTAMQKKSKSREDDPAFSIPAQDVHAHFQEDMQSRLETPGVLPTFPDPDFQRLIENRIQEKKTQASRVWDEDERAELVDKALIHSDLDKCPSDILTLPIRKAEVDLALSKAKSDKAPGLDGVQKDLLAIMAPTLRDALTYLYRLAQQLRYWPKDSMAALITLIYKKGDPTVISNWRPISLLPTIYKILSRIINERLGRFNQLMENIGPHQGGFVKGLDGKTRHLLTSTMMQSTAVMGVRIAPPLCQLLVDARNAFGTMEVPAIRQGLRYGGVPDSMIELIESFYAALKVTVRTGDGLTNWIRQGRGVCQGCPLSPLLFNMGLEPTSQYVLLPHAPAPVAL